MNDKHFIPSESGSSLVAVLMALGLFSVLALGLNRMTLESLRSTKSIEGRTNLEALKQMVLNRLDCSKTVPSEPLTACAKDRFVELKSKNGLVFLPDKGPKGEKLGSHNIRAVCSASQRGIIVEAWLTNAQGEGLADPLTRNLVDFTDAFKGVRFCADNFDNQATAEEAYLKSQLEYFPTGNFRASGGKVRIVVQQINEKADCNHSVRICGQNFSKQGSVLLKDGDVCRVEIASTGKAYCLGTLSMLSSNIMLAKQGQNLWSVHVEDSTDFDYNDSVWKIVGVPEK